MRVKVGDKVYSCEKDGPLMVILSHQDKTNIISMEPSASRYAVFPEGYEATKEQKLEWMKD